MSKNSFFKILVLALVATTVAWHILTVVEDSYVIIISNSTYEKFIEIEKEEEEESYNDDTLKEDVSQNRQFEGNDFHYIEKIEKNENSDIELKEPVQEEVVFTEKHTKEGVIFYTNEERLKESKDTLTESEKLTIASQIKLNDLFIHQYFAHSNESGEMDSGDLASIVGYDYILIGENLALGNFDNDQDLVEAWMDSPGHRSNILREGYTEIGVALKEGFFKGEKVWIAVQIFGTPISECSKPDKELEAEIEEKSIYLESVQDEILYLSEQLKQGDLSREQYNELAKKHNLLVEQYNSLVLEIESLVDLLNQQIDYFNECVQEIS